MRVMVLVKATKDSEAGIVPSPELLQTMGTYNDPKFGGWPDDLAVGLGRSSRFAGGIRRATGSGAVRADGP